MTLHIKNLRVLTFCAALFATAPGLGRTEEVDPLIKKGLALYKSGNYAEAALSFRDAYEKNPDWRLRLNIGQCELLLKKYDLAMEEFSAYLKEGGDAITEERKAYASEQIGLLADKVASLKLIETDLLKVFIDEVPRGTTPMEAPVYVLPGEHRIVFKEGDSSVFEKVVIVSVGEELSIERPRPVPEPKPEPAPPKENPRPSDKTETPERTQQTESNAQIRAPVEHKRSPLKPIGVTMLVVGSAALVPGIITGAISASDKNDLEKNCPDKNNCSDTAQTLKNSAEKYAIAANILLPIGGVLAATGIVLTVVGIKKTKRDKAMTFLPLMENHTAGFCIEGRF